MDRHTPYWGGWAEMRSRKHFFKVVFRRSQERRRGHEHVQYPREEGQPGPAPEEAGGSLAEVVAFSSTKRTEEQVGNTIAENAKQGARNHGLKVGSPVSNLSIPWELVRGSGSWGRRPCFDPLHQVVLLQLGPEGPAEIGDLELEMDSLALSSPDKQVPRGAGRGQDAGGGLKSETEYAGQEECRGGGGGHATERRSGVRAGA